MSSLCTGIFFIIISGGIHRDMMEWEKGNQLEYVGNRLQVYIKDYQAYPERITDIFPQTRQHEDDVAIYTEKSGCVRVDDVKSNPCFKDLIHFFPLPENAPNDLLWLWVNPDQYYSTKMPVVLFDGSFRTIKKSELPALIERSRKWLAENPQPDKAPSTQKAK